MTVRKRAGRVGALALALVTTPVLMAPASSTGATTTWRLDLVEPFNVYDSSRWHAWDNIARPTEDALLLARNVSVSDGALRIRAKKESVGGRRYTSGALDTYGRYSLPNYFRVWVRAKVPQEQGMWPAPLWLRPDGPAGAAGSEIDLVETIGRDAERGWPKIHQTIHGVYGTSQHTSRSTPFAWFGDWSGTRWHNYEIVKTPGRIVMKVDGRRTALFTPANTPWFSSIFEVGARWAFRVNLQVGGKWAGLPDWRTNWAPRRTTMYVDEIRVWVPR